MNAASAPESCGACAVAVNSEVARITRRLLVSLDPERLARLTGAFQGTPVPEVLCADCFLPAVSMVNGAMMR